MKKKLKLTELEVQSFITSEEAKYLIGGSGSLVACQTDTCSHNDVCITHKYGGCMATEHPLC